MKGNLLRSKGHKNDPSAKIQCCAMSLFLCPSLQYFLFHIPLPCFSCRFCLGFLPELYVESLFVFHIGLIQWSVCMFVRSVMRMHDSNLTLCGRLCHTKSIFKYNQKENNVYGLSSHFENYSSHSEPLNSAHVGRDNDHWNTHPLFFYLSL